MTARRNASLALRPAGRVLATVLAAPVVALAPLSGPAVALAPLSGPAAELLASARAEVSADAQGEGSAGVQDEAPAAEAAEVAEVDRMLEAAREASPAVRPQAARRLVELGAPAAERLLAEAGESPADLARLGTDVVEVLGELESSALRAKVWDALGEPDFPWRPAAARTLARSARPEERARFRTLRADPLSPVRDAAVEAYEQLELRDAADEVRALLADENDRVRRSAAVLLDRWGEPGVLLWLVEDLKREDRFFAQRTGKAARYASMRALAERLGDLHGYDPEAPAEENAEALARITEDALDGHPAPELPRVARASRATDGDVIGLELRSCRRGEHFLRWNANDVLYVGQGNPTAVELPAGTVARLVEAARPRLDALGKRRMWGEPGCDVEQLHFAPPDERRPRSYQVAKGYEEIEGLRPAELDALVRELVPTLPETGADPRLVDLRANVLEALAVLGGPLEPSDE